MKSLFGFIKPGDPLPRVAGGMGYTEQAPCLPVAKSRQCVIDIVPEVRTVKRFQPRFVLSRTTFQVTHFLPRPFPQVSPQRYQLLEIVEAAIQIPGARDEIAIAVGKDDKPGHFQRIDIASCNGSQSPRQ